MRARIAALAHTSLVRLTLIALLVGALVPAGWMPNPDGAASGVPIVICTGHGPITAFIGKDGKPLKKPLKPSGSHSNICIFAAAAAHATPTVAPILTLPYAEELAVAPAREPAAIVLSAQRSSYNPRGPPRSA